MLLMKQPNHWTHSCRILFILIFSVNLCPMMTYKLFLFMKKTEYCIDLNFNNLISHFLLHSRFPPCPTNSLISSDASISTIPMRFLVVSQPNSIPSPSPSVRYSLPSPPPLIPRCSPRLLRNGLITPLLSPARTKRTLTNSTTKTPNCMKI